VTWPAKMPRVGCSVSGWTFSHERVFIVRRTGMLALVSLAMAIAAYVAASLAGALTLPEESRPSRQVNDCGRVSAKVNWNSKVGHSG
jgi:hypothetical protein